MNKIAAFKKTVTVVIGFGVSKIVNDIIANNVEIEKAHQQVTVPVASFAIGGAVAQASSEYTDSFIDECVDFWQKIRNRNQSAE
jgi:hypothetical protein